MRSLLAMATGMAMWVCFAQDAQAQSLDTTKTATKTAAVASMPAVKAPASPSGHAPKKWYDLISLRGYTQIRYNRLMETNPKLKNEQGDKSIGENGGIFIRRARLVFSGQVSNSLYIYIQPDLAASASSTNLHFLQLRDAYFDWSMDSAREFRFRIGQSKIPFGFENLQSSQNRMAFDRGDALNSALANERDLGAIFYWAPAKIRQRFSDLISKGLKGSGDYGVFGLGVFNGQTANKPTVDNNLHYVARLSYPFQLKNGQIFEAGAQAYTGIYTVTTDQRTATSGTTTKGLKTETNNFSFTDQRAAATFVLYPQPFGVMAEYNIGRGPEFNAGDTSIQVKSLNGGSVTLSYKLEACKQLFYPYARYQFYNGGKKHELDARSYRVKEYEFGLEWQPTKNVEVTAAYVMSDRTTSDAAKLKNAQQGNFLRLQLQFNY